MSKVRVAGFGVSLDGFSAGIEQSLSDPLGKRGTEIFQWFFHTRSFRAMHGGEGGTSDGDTPRASLVKEPQSMPASSKNGATALPPCNHQPDSQPSASLLEPPVHTWMTIRGASYTGASKNQSKPRQGNAHRSRRLHPHEPLAGAGARATETGTKLEGLIPRRRRRLRRLVVDDWKHKPRQAST